MFDCPLQTQTSPTSTSLISTASPPLSPAIVIVSGPPACNGLRVNDHLPPLATALASWSRILTVTVSPSSAVPQTGKGLPRWRTAPSENSGWGVTLASAGRASTVAR